MGKKISQVSEKEMGEIHFQCLWSLDSIFFCSDLVGFLILGRFGPCEGILTWILAKVSSSLLLDRPLSDSKEHFLW